MKCVGIREAKNTLSKLLKQAKEAPVLISHHGRPDSVVLSYEHYQRLTGKTGLDLFKDFDWSEVDLEPHSRFEQRDIKLG